jgi:hypothetical protein
MKMITTNFYLYLKHVSITILFLFTIIPVIGNAADCTFIEAPCIARPDNPFWLCRYGMETVDAEGDCVFVPNLCISPLDDEHCVDLDGDTIPDYIETNGYDPGNYGILPVGWATIDLPAYGAHPLRRDLFLEIDCIVSDANGNGLLTDPVDHSHCPSQNAIEMVVQAFANAPVANADGTTGIQLHVDVGTLYGDDVIHQVPGVGGAIGTYGDLRDSVFNFTLGGGDQIPELGNEIIDWDGAAGNPGTSFYTLKRTYFNQTRSLIGVLLKYDNLPFREAFFRYGIFGHQTNNRQAVGDCTRGWAETPGNDLMVTLGGSNVFGRSCTGVYDANGFPTGDDLQQAGTLMHEFGHNLGLGHGGGDAINNKWNYLSVMNYAFASCSIMPAPNGNPLLPGGCDFSAVALPIPTGVLDERSLDECVGLDGGIFGFGPIDWDGDGILEGNTCPEPNTTNVAFDLNGDDECVTSGTNGVIDTTPNEDDVLRIAAGGTRQWIEDGPNLTCNTKADGDDVQVKSVGQSQPNPHFGHVDWQNLEYGFLNQSAINDLAGPPPYEEDLRTEVIKAAQKLLVERTRGMLVPTDYSPPGDIDNDTDVDKDDINLILSFRNQPASVNPECDLDGDGTITVLDARKCAILCTRPGCAIK